MIQSISLDMSSLLESQLQDHQLKVMFYKRQVMLTGSTDAEITTTSLTNIDDQRNFHFINEANWSIVMLQQ